MSIKTLMSQPKRLQINIRLDKDPDLYQEVKEKAELLNTSITDFTLDALRTAVGWQIPANASAMLGKINTNNSEIRKLKKELAELKKLLNKN